jgi:molybdopterin-containing oxidoreductase family iron-sulfur binding subunit
MTIDLDRCTGCQACVVACQSENNVPINEASAFHEGRVIEWIKIERYWEGEFPNIKARFIPILCQHCENAPCEPVCPVYATYHNDEGLNVQVYNRCVGTRYCGNNCPYHARSFNYWEPVWPESLRHQLNPDVTVRTRGVMEKCSLCVQRIRRSTIGGTKPPDGAFDPACVQACPTGAMVFGDMTLDGKDGREESRVHALANDERHFKVFELLGTAPSVTYLKQVDTNG